MLRRRKGATPDPGPSGEGREFCAMCGQAVPVGDDGRCDLGHRVRPAGARPEQQDPDVPVPAAPVAGPAAAGVAAGAATAGVAGTEDDDDRALLRGLYEEDEAGDDGDEVPDGGDVDLAVGDDEDDRRSALDHDLDLGGELDF